jgi:hypothetical protein
MKALQAMRKLGFRKWYERSLMRSHGHLVLLLLSSLALLGAAEAFSKDASFFDQLTLFACAAVSAVIGVWALRRYFYLLQYSEYVANQAACEQCHAYAKWDITGEDIPNRTMTVCCKKCGHPWSIGL